MSLTNILEEERRRAISNDDWVSKVVKRLKEMSKKMENLMRELDESRKKEEEMAELKQRLTTRLEEQETEMGNKSADREASYEILLHARKEQVEAQRALEEQLENNTERKDGENRSPPQFVQCLL